jgi:hypothetical protein
VRQDDILRARIKTLGVSEYKFDMLPLSYESAAGNALGNKWSLRVFDVGGQRALVSAQMFYILLC